MFNLFGALVSVGVLTLTIACSATFVRYRRKCRCTKQFSRQDYVLIVGSAPGIALETAMEIIKRGGRVVLGNKSIADAEKMGDKIKSKLNPESNTVMVLKLDLTSFAQIRNFAKILEAALGVNKLAGVVITEELRDAPFELTEDKYDKMFQINYLGPFLLVETVGNLLKNHPDPRIVTLASGKCSPCQFVDIANLVISLKKRVDDRTLAYHISKVCIALMSLKWGCADCVDPGKNIGDNLSFKEKPLNGVEGIMHALLKPMENVSYASLRLMYTNISPLCVEVIDELENDNKNLLSHILYKASKQVVVASSKESKS